MPPSFRPQNACHKCRDTWYPKGRNLSKKCPNCGSPKTYILPEFTEKRSILGDSNDSGGCIRMFVVAMLLISGIIFLCLFSGSWLRSKAKDLKGMIPKKEKTPQRFAPKKVPIKPVSLKPKNAAPVIKPKQKEDPKPIKITATSSNAIDLANERYKKARKLFNGNRYTRNEEAAINIFAAYNIVTEASKIISKLGKLDRFADRTLARHIISLGNDCERRLSELESLGVKIPKEAKSKAVVEVIEKAVPKKIDTRPIVSGKSGYGGSDIYHAKFYLENKVDKPVEAKSINVVFYDAFGLKIGEDSLEGSQVIPASGKRKFTAKYAGNDAGKIKTFKVEVK